MAQMKKFISEHRMAMAVGFSTLLHLSCLAVFFRPASDSGARFQFAQSYSSVSLYPIRGSKPSNAKQPHSLEQKVTLAVAAGNGNAPFTGQVEVSQFFQAGALGFTGGRAKTGNASPEYPRAAREQGVEGLVKLRVSVNSAGTVSEVKVVKSSGATVLDDAAAYAVRKWSFEPMTVAGVPRDSVLVIPVRFQLRER